MTSKINISNSKEELYKVNFLFNELMYTKKNVFLKKLKSKSSYKRYTESPLRYGGGKSLAVGNILEYLPDKQLLALLSEGQVLNLSKIQQN